MEVFKAMRALHSQLVVAPFQNIRKSDAIRAVRRLETWPLSNRSRHVAYALQRSAEYAIEVQRVTGYAAHRPLSIRTRAFQVDQRRYNVFLNWFQ
jgi:hypothetical protein